MIKHAQESIDPATQEYGTSIEVPGSTKSVKGTPIGITGERPDRKPGLCGNGLANRGQKPPSMRKSDFGVRIAMDNNYVQGLIDKCAEAGVDPEVLVKESVNWAAMGAAIKPVLKTLNPLNLWKAPGKIMEGYRRKGALRSGVIERIMKANPNAASNLDALSTKANNALSYRPSMAHVNNRLARDWRNLGGGAASTAAIGGGIYGATRPEPEPEGIGDHIKALMGQYGLGR